MTRLIPVLLCFAVILAYLSAPPHVCALITAVGNVEPDTSTWTSNMNGYVGRSSDGTLILDSGSQLLTGMAYVGYDSGVTGLLTVDGQGSTLKCNSMLTVGRNGAGTLDVIRGGTATVNSVDIAYYATSTSAITIDGSGSQLNCSYYLHVGTFGTATLNITEGGTVNDLECKVATVAGSVGTVSVDGTMSKLTNTTTLSVGLYGNGRLDVSNGGSVRNLDAVIGVNEGSLGTASVSGVASNWSTTRDLTIGQSGSGGLDVSSGGLVASTNVYIGKSSGSVGLVGVTGDGSVFQAAGNLFVGRDGNGTLNITAGGLASIGGTTHIGYSPTSTGVIDFGSGGGTLATGSLAAAPSALKGIGTVNARGIVSDLDLVFDSDASLSRTLLFNSQPGQNVRVNLDLASAPDSNGALGAGWAGNGSLAIQGVTIKSKLGYIGCTAGSTGIMTVDGTGSAWMNSSDLSVGEYGVGTLNIKNGASVANQLCTVGRWASGSGAVRVEGAGSVWSSNKEVYIGQYGTGTLSILAGGQVTSNYHCLVGDNRTATGVVLVDGNGSQWTSINVLTVGNWGKGSLRISGGGAVSDSSAYIGFTSAALGTVVVEGPGSTWSTAQALTITNGSVSIVGGGTVNSGWCVVGYRGGTTGRLNIDGTGSTLNTGGLGVGTKGAGAMNITAGGKVVVNGSSGSHIGVDEPTIVNVDGVGTTWTTTNLLWIGYHAYGTINITDGAVVSAANTHIQAPSPGSPLKGVSVIKVDGPGSRLMNTDQLVVGVVGRGRLEVSNGAVVSNSRGEIGVEGNGLAIVDGSGSKWINTASLEVCVSGPGTLYVNNGGEVTGPSLVINSYGLAVIDVGHGSKFSAAGGTAAFTNNGTVRLTAGPGIASGTAYSPIVASQWLGTGTCEPVGGRWDAAAHTFTVYDPLEGSAATQLIVNLFDKQRLLISDAATQWELGASFVAPASAKTLKLTATPISGAVQTSLATLLDADAELAGGWQFAVAGGYTTGEPAYLSFEAGPGHTRADFAVWKYNGSAWAAFDAPDLTYDGQYASFSTSDLSGYAVSAVPEPGTLALLIAGLAVVAVGVRKYESGKGRRV